MIFKTHRFTSVYKYIIFDFDGTINDTAEGVLGTLRKTAVLYDVDLTGMDLNRFIGPPMENTMRELVGDKWQEAVDVYRKMYAEDGAALQCKPYEGVPEMLSTLRDKGYVLCVATSKYLPYAQEALDHFALTPFFTYVYGTSGHRSKKEEILCDLIEENHLDRRLCLMIGDTVYDVEGAHKAGIDAVAVSYGFGKRADLLAKEPEALVDAPAEIVKLICGAQ